MEMRETPTENVSSASLCTPPSLLELFWPFLLHRHQYPVLIHIAGPPRGFTELCLQFYLKTLRGGEIAVVNHYIYQQRKED